MRPTTALAALMVAASLTSCSGAGPPQVTVGPPAAASPSPSAAATASPAAKRPSPAATIDPLTGRAGVPAGPVVALKIDNVRGARPYHRGLDRAPVVYQELVEHGATRLLAIFTGRSGEEIGPIRSVRESDAELLAQYGRVVFGYSGGNRGVLATMRKADVVNIPEDFIHGAFRQGERRGDIYNFYTSTARITGYGSGVGVRDIGLRFGVLPAGVGRAATSGGVAFSSSSRVSWTYDAGTGRWVLAQDGRTMRPATGGRVTPANIIVQYVPVRRSGYVDAAGSVTPFTSTVGTGRAVVWRDGRSVDVAWTRPNAKAGTHFLDAAGRDLPLRPGQTWVLLVPAR